MKNSTFWKGGEFALFQAGFPTFHVFSKKHHFFRGPGGVFFLGIGGVKLPPRALEAGPLLGGFWGGSRKWAGLAGSGALFGGPEKAYFPIFSVFPGQGAEKARTGGSFQIPVSAY